MNGKTAAGARRRVAMPSLIAAVALLAAGCAMQDASSPHAAFSATSFVATVGTGTVSFPKANATLTPLAATGNAAAGKVTATDAAGQSVTLVDGDTAYGAVVQDGIEGLTAGNLAGPVTGGLYSYYNSAYGQIQPDGTVKLTYQGTPVWLFIAPLIHYVNDAVVPITPSNSPWPTPNYTGCSYIYIVDAASGSLLTNGQHCTSS
jgi:ABC-type Fe3+-hydroxamate transport system substrate-binding protein